MSGSTQTQTLSAILFLYLHVLECELGWLENVVRAKRSSHIPDVFTHGEAKSVLLRMIGINGIVGRLLYDSGMRGSESVRSRAKDLEFEQLQVVVRDAKEKMARVTLGIKTPGQFAARQTTIACLSLTFRGNRG